MTAQTTDTVTAQDAAPTAGPGLTGTYDLDPAHSRIGFATKHAMVATVRGQFTEFTGTAYLDEEHPEQSTAHVEIRTASINTGNEQRDGHLRTGDFFDVETHPSIVFDSTKVEQLGGDRYRLHGDLTIKGVTRPVSVDWDFSGTSPDPWGGFRAGFEGATTINRKDWGLTWNVALETGGILVGDKVKLEFDIAAVKRPA
jgi:polyisoprenoid-binding protein YceI